MNVTCFIRADANLKIGYGHLSRCRIIAMELRKNGLDPVFLFYDTMPAIKKELTESGYRYLNLPGNDPDAIISCREEIRADKYVLIFDTDVEDYYREESQLKLIEAGFKVIFFTFWDHYTYHAHLIINQNPLGLTLRYRTAHYTRELIGPEFMVFDDQFLNLSPPARTSPHLRELHFFVSFGGTDFPNSTLKTVRALQLSSLPVKSCHIVIGAMYRHEKELYEEIEEAHFPCSVYRQVKNIAEVMLKANIGISSGGLTLWELAVLRIPTAVMSYSPREVATATFLDEEGLTYHMGSTNDLSTGELCEKIVKFVRSDELRGRTSKLRKRINMNGKSGIIQEILSLIHD